MKTIAFLTFRSMSMTCTCSVSLSPAIFALRDTRVHIGASDSSDVMTDAKTPID